MRLVRRQPSAEQMRNGDDVRHGYNVSPKRLCLRGVASPSICEPHRRSWLLPVIIHLVKNDLLRQNKKCNLDFNLARFELSLGGIWPDLFRLRTRPDEFKKAPTKYGD
jgi:hypothetical protein